MITLKSNRYRFSRACLKTFTAGIAAIALGAAPLAAQSLLIAPTSITSSTSASDEYSVAHLIDGIGLTVNPPTLDDLGTQEGLPGETLWASAQAGSDYYSFLPAPVLTCELPFPVWLNELVIWGYPNANEAKTFELTFSTDGTNFGNPVTVTQPTMIGSGAMRLPFPDGARLASHVRINITDNHYDPAGAPGGDRVGLGELRFVVAQPLLIAPTSITSSTSASDEYSVAHLIDGIGLTVNPPTLDDLGTQEGLPGETLWASAQAGSDYYTFLPAPVLTCELPFPGQVIELVIWGYPNESEAKTFEVTFSTDGTNFGDPVTVTQPTMIGSGAMRLPFPDGTRLASHVRVNITDNHYDPAGAPGGDRVGLGELRFVVLSEVVTNNADSGAGSLRQAISDANSGSVIIFDPSLSGQTITLTSGQLVLNNSLTIDASALPGGITIEANDASRIVEVSSGQTILLANLTLTGGNGEGSTNSGNGGAVSNSGTLTLQGCTVTLNSASWGGGIHNAGGAILNLIRSTVSQNTAAIDGGGMMLNPESTSMLRNSTISGNTAAFKGAGIYLNLSSNATITHCTIAGNTAGNQGGGSMSRGTVILNNTIVAGNTAPNGGPDFYRQSATVTPTGVNLLGDVSDSSLSPGAMVLVGAPLLAPLGNYGGTTQTMPPLPGSPAIDGAIGSTATTDQRGFARPNGPLPDIGAVEAYPFTSQGFVDTDSDGIDDRLETGFFSNLTSANATSDFDGDGSSDKDEIANMTNARDSNDFFRILSFTKAAGFTPANPVFDLTISSFPGLGYRLERQSDLTNAFQPFGDDFTATGFTSTFQVTLNPSRDFVRAARK